MLRLTASALLLLALTGSGCGSPGPAALRHPGFRPSKILRPAVLLQVSLDHTGLFGEGEFSRQDRDSIPEAFELALIEALNAEAILPVEVTLVAQRNYRAHATPFEQIDRAQALQRARTVNADVVLILDARLSRQDLVYCREARRPFIARTTFWTLGAEVLRVSDGARLLVKPPGPPLRLGDLEPDCERGRTGRRLSSHELLDTAVHQALSLLLGK